MLTVKGIVLTQKPLGEQDKFIDILTAEHGVLEVLVKGSAKINSKSGSAAQLFAYSEFCLADSSRGVRRLNSVAPIQIFYGLRQSVTAVALASYFSQILLYAVLPSSGTPELLRLLLNCLHYLSEQKYAEWLIKAVFELRAASLLGFMPDVTICRRCGAYLPENVVFSVPEGCFWCGDCVPASPAALPPYMNGEDLETGHICMSAAGLLAVRHVVLSDFEKIFSFRLAESCQKAFCAFAEAFLQYHIDRNFQTLGYYKVLSGTSD